MDETQQVQDQVQGQSENQDGGGANDTPKVKIGEVEYTTEQLTELIGKGSKYDELLPDYTRKSQELASIKNNNKEQTKQDDTNTPPCLREDWEPKTYDELRKAILWAKDAGKEEALKTLQQKESEAQQVKQQVDEFVAETKKANKDFNEQDFFNYVLRHNFPAESVDNLKSAYSTYKELSEAKKLGAQDALKQPQDKVNKGDNSGGNKTDFTDLRIKSGDMVSTALEALKRIK